jgi:hypothetical protein
MNPIPEELLDSGLTYDEYRRSITRNAEVFDEVYRQPDFTAADLDLLRRLPPLQVAAIGEDWCPDVFHTLPTWARVAEEVEGWTFRVFERDRHPGLMDCFLYRSKSRRIPVYAFYDHQCYLQTWWSGRGAEAQAAVDGWLAGRTYDQLDEDSRKDIGRRFAGGYRTEFRRRNFLEILALLRAFFHVG